MTPLGRDVGVERVVDCVNLFEVCVKLEASMDVDVDMDVMSDVVCVDTTDVEGFLVVVVVLGRKVAPCCFIASTAEQTEFPRDCWLVYCSMISLLSLQSQ